MIRIEIPQSLRELPTPLTRFGNDAATLGRKVWLAGLGVVATVEETATDTFQTLIVKGKKSRTFSTGEAEKAVATARRRAQKVGREVGSLVESQVSGVLGRLGVVSRREVQELTRRVETLADSLR
jgi:poly(hydroxyalkanoate) granule-associated protein